MEINISLAKAKLFELSQKAHGGNEIIISKNGKPQSVLIGFEKYRDYHDSILKRQNELLERIRAHRRKQRPQTNSTKILRELREGRF